MQINEKNPESKYGKQEAQVTVCTVNGWIKNHKPLNAQPQLEDGNLIIFKKFGHMKALIMKPFITKKIINKSRW